MTNKIYSYDLPDRIYMAVHVRDDEHEELEPWEQEILDESPAPEPEGWREYALDRWGSDPGEYQEWPNGHMPFFFPKVGVPYRSRSAAQKRVDIINRWGGRAVVVECTPQWETVERANKRRTDARVQTRIEKKRAELAELEAQLE